MTKVNLSHQQGKRITKICLYNSYRLLRVRYRILRKAIYIPLLENGHSKMPENLTKEYIKKVFIKIEGASFEELRDIFKELFGEELNYWEAEENWWGVKSVAEFKKLDKSIKK